MNIVIEESDDDDEILVYPKNNVNIPKNNEILHDMYSEDILKIRFANFTPFYISNADFYITKII